MKQGEGFIGAKSFLLLSPLPADTWIKFVPSWPCLPSPKSCTIYSCPYVTAFIERPHCAGGQAQHHYLVAFRDSESVANGELFDLPACGHHLHFSPQSFHSSIQQVFIKHLLGTKNCVRHRLYIRNKQIYFLSLWLLQLERERGAGSAGLGQSESDSLRRLHLRSGLKDAKNEQEIILGKRKLSVQIVRQKQYQGVLEEL